LSLTGNDHNDLQVIAARNFKMEALIFFVCLVIATLGIIAGLYAICKDTKSHRGVGVASYRNERFWNFR
jgi:hypothetical protein